MQQQSSDPSWMTFYQIYQKERAHIGDLFNLIFIKLERRQYELLHPLHEATTILLEALQESSLDMFFNQEVGLALFLGELLHRGGDDVLLVDL